MVLTVSLQQERAMMMGIRWWTSALGVRRPETELSLGSEVRNLVGYILSIIDAVY